VGKVTIVPEPDRYFARLTQFEELTKESIEDWANEVVILCAGFAAQVVFGDDVVRAKFGAASDLENAEQIIKCRGSSAH
jgi:hypothetical protein